RTGVERRSTLARATLHQLAAILGTEHARWHRPRAATLGESAAAEELPAAPLANDHRRTAEMTLVLRHHRFGFLAFDGPRVLALLRMILAGEEWTEESAARLEPAAALRTAFLLDDREIVGDRDERARVDLVQPRRERRVEVLEDLLPAELTV